MAPKKSTRVYALAAATVITAGTLSYVPATFASEAGNTTGSDTSAAESVQENSSLQTTEALRTKPSTPTQSAPAQETAPAPAQTVAPQSSHDVAEAPESSETASAQASETSASEAAQSQSPKASQTAETPSKVIGNGEDEGDDTSEGRQNAPKVTVDAISISGDTEFTPVTVRVSGFYGARVGSAIEVRVQEVNAQGRPVGAPIATGRVSAQALVDGTASATVNISSKILAGGKNYAVVAVSNPGGKDHLVAGTIVELKQRRIANANPGATPAPQATEKKETAPAAPAQPEKPENGQKPEATESASPKAQESASAAPRASAEADRSASSDASEADTAVPSASASASESASANPSATPEESESAAQDSTIDMSNKASLRVDSAHFAGDAATNVVVVRGTGFTGEHVSEGVEVTMFELDDEGKAQGEAIKSVFVKPSEIVDGSFTARLEVDAAKLRPGYSYGIVAVGNPKGEEHVQAYTVAMVSDDSHPAPGEDNDTNVAATRPGTKTAGRVTNNGGRGGAAVLNGNAEGYEDQSESGVNTVSTPHKNSNSAAATSAHKRNLARTGADGVLLMTTLGGSTLAAGTALVVARRRKKDNA